MLDSQIITIKYKDSEINTALAKTTAAGSSCTYHFNQNEEYFIKFKTEFTVPSLPIHHDVRIDKPENEYLKKIRSIFNEIFLLAPDLFRESTYFFDPADILKLHFFRVYKIKETRYLYLQKIDLMYRSQEATIIEKGTNDMTPEYKTTNLYANGRFIPLESVVADDDKLPSFQIKQTLSDTWIGESGRGYLAKGIWIDDDLTKFFTQLFLPPKKKIYPCYPFGCQHKTICYTPLDLSPEGRKSSLPYLHNALSFLNPYMGEIQKDLRNSSFTRDSALFKSLKSRVPEGWNVFLENLKMEIYLNDNDMKEFRVEF